MKQPTTSRTTDSAHPGWLQRGVRRQFVRTLDKIKAKLRDWLFADYKWITRAQVQREICALRWQYRDHKLVQRVLNELQETIK